MAKRTILVTGATGTVGSEVIKQLASISSSSDYDIIAAVHSQNKTDKLKQISEDIEIVDLNYAKSESVTHALDKVDGLFLQTLPVPDAIDICSNLVKEAKKNDVKYIVKLSAMGAASKSESTILRLHGKEEKIIEESGIPYTFLRPIAFMQNFVTQFGHTIRTQYAFYVPAGNAKLGFIDARDIAAVAVKMLTESYGASHPDMNKTYDITGDEVLSYRQVAEILSDEVDKKISYVDVTEEDAQKGMKQAGTGEWFIHIMTELFRIIRAGYGSQTTDVFEHIIGRKPIPLVIFAKDYAQSFR